MSLALDPKEYIADESDRGLFRVRRKAFTSQEVLDIERREVFNKSWLYVGHESEVSSSGDFISRDVGGRPIIMVRGKDEKVRVFFNACAHRGNAVCREKQGTAARFFCFYHAWAYNLQGDLISVPFDEAYSGDFNRKNLGLSSPAQVDSYRGLVFVNFDAKAPGLIDFFGNAREHLDYMLDYSGEDLEICPGTQSYSVRANWKLLVENSIDVYHGFIVHRRYFDTYLTDVGIERASSLITLDRGADGGRGLALDNGHAVIEMPVPALPLDQKQGERLREQRRMLEEKHGVERASRILDVSRNLVLFPNLVFVSNWRTIRTFYPVRPDYMEVSSWALFPRSDPPEVRQARLANFITFLGPGGFGQPDDVEALEGCQRGYTATEDGWSDNSRGLGHSEQVSSDEEQIRCFWRRWAKMVGGSAYPAQQSDCARKGIAA